MPRISAYQKKKAEIQELKAEILRLTKIKMAFRDYLRGEYNHRADIKEQAKNAFLNATKYREPHYAVEIKQLYPVSSRDFCNSSYKIERFAKLYTVSYILRYGKKDEEHVMEVDAINQKEAVKIVKDEVQRFWGKHAFHVKAKKKKVSKQYEELTVEEKAAIAAKLLDNGYNDHGDTCKIDETGHYTFVTSGGEFSAYQTPAELLNDFIWQYGEKPLKEEYNK